MTFTHRVADPKRDLDLIFEWVTQPRAEFWGMTDHTREQVAEIYEFLDSLDTHHVYLVLENDEPVAMFQTYQPEHDPMGECYEVQPGDLGGHLFIGPTDVPRSGFTESVFAYAVNFLFQDPAVQRLVAEPDHRNTKSIALGHRVGSNLHGRVDLGHKQADLFFLTRADWAALQILRGDAPVEGD